MAVTYSLCLYVLMHSQQWSDASPLSMQLPSVGDITKMSKLMILLLTDEPQLPPVRFKR